MFFPATACIVQNKVRATRAWGFDLSAACSGFLYALTVGAQFIESGAHNKVVVIGASASRDFPLVDAPPRPRTPFEVMYVSVFDNRLTSLVRSGFLSDQQYLPAQGVLAVRDGFGFVAAQLDPQAGMPAGIGTYVRAIHLP